MCSTEFYGPLSPPRTIYPNNDNPNNKRARFQNNAVTPNKTSQLVILDQSRSSQESSEDEESPAKKKAKPVESPPLTQPPHEKESGNESEANAPDDAMTEGSDSNITAIAKPPDINHFLSTIGEERASIIDNLHWLAMTALSGSTNLYVQVVETRDKDLRIKKAVEEAEKEQLADKVAYKMANERSADMPVIEEVINQQTSKQLKAQERRIQSIEDRVGNIKKKKNGQEQANNSSNNNGRPVKDKKAKKDPRGAASAASKTKSAKARKTHSSKPSAKEKQGRAGGESSEGTERGSSGNQTPRQQPRSRKKKEPTKNKTNSQPARSKRK